MNANSLEWVTLRVGRIPDDFGPVLEMRLRYFEDNHHSTTCDAADKTEQGIKIQGHKHYQERLMS